MFDLIRWRSHYNMPANGISEAFSLPGFLIAVAVIASNIADRAS